jgi:BlaI family transcriptional regulator, penicillinase repressor
MTDSLQLSRRERQIMDVIYARGTGTASDVLACLSDPPGRVSVRTFLRILEEKGHLVHKIRGREFVYEPTRPRKREGQSALRRVLHTFFEGSLSKAVTAHMSDPASDLSPEELKHLEQLVKKARKREEDRP